MLEFILEMAAKYPAFSSLFMIMGVLRAVFKPLMTLLHAYVEATPTEKDNELLEKLKKSKAYGAVVWLLDYFASVKLPKAKKQKKDQ